MRLFFVFALVIASAVASPRRYDGYQVFEVKAKDAEAFKAMVRLFEESTNYDFWTQPKRLNEPMDVMVPPAFSSNFLHVLEVFGLEYRLKFPDVQALIDESMKDMAQPQIQPRGLRNRQASPKYALNWTAYHNYETIMAFVDEIAANNPRLVTVTRPGSKTSGNRDMPLVKISSGGTGKKAIFVDGGIHAREWISPAFTTWLIHELVENYNAHPQYVDKVDWYIMPLINPDGYAYSWSDDRLWRKNRDSNPGSTCVGTDLNRNFGFQWNTGGSSPLACSDTYHGGAAFSEIESRNVRDVVNSIKSQALVYLTFHSYGQYWLTPWGYTSTLPDDYASALYPVAKGASDALTALYGTRYTVGSSTNVLYVASGGSDDWAKGDAGVKYSYTVEMRDTNTFVLPATQIIPNNLEVWEGIKYIVDTLF